MMKKVELNDQDIIELKNIVNCLKSDDLETYKLGKSLFESKWPNDLYISLGDIIIKFEPWWDNFCSNRDFSEFFHNHVVSQFIFILFNSMIYTKYYLINVQNN